MSAAPGLSVIVPAYNEAARLPRTLATIAAHLAGREHEVLVVDDGSGDATAACATAAGATRVLRHQPNRGKGYAVRRGMLEARGERRLMTDADLSTPIEELARLEAALDSGADVAIGSRAVSGARIELHQPRYREALGRCFNRLVRLLLLPGLQDTQCGFKLYTAAAAEAAFGPARLDGFCFDVESLVLARRGGMRVAEVPVRWLNDAASRVSLLGGGRAFLDLLVIRWNLWRGRYDTSGV
jgi:dolichyl-phosphate beta-glucosyltransferase